MLLKHKNAVIYGAGGALGGAVAAAIFVSPAVMPSHTQVEPSHAQAEAAIKPFKAHIPDAVLDVRRCRLAEAKWPPVQQGTTLGHIRLTSTGAAVWTRL
jgi:hypothetical protein